MSTIWTTIWICGRCGARCSISDVEPPCACGLHWLMPLWSARDQGTGDIEEGQRGRTSAINLKML